ncbi:MAG: histidine kinase [Lewinellaceae bacterium]|nr:histidine kinase [Lewinellaceae bacterium]
MPQFSKNTLFALLTALLLFHVVLNAQHPSWQNFTTRDGLPSNEIYGMLQDSRGLLWFSTDQGICHFNGYEFIRPVDTSAARAGSTFQIVEDALGRIWFMHLDGTLSIIENDTVRLWKYNHLLKSFLHKYRTTNRFAIEKDGVVWIPSLKYGFLIVRPDGTQKIIPELGRPSDIFSEIDGQFIMASEETKDGIGELNFMQRTNQTREIIQWQNGKALSMGRFPADLKKVYIAEGFKIWRFKNGDIIGRYLQTYYLIRNHVLIWHGQKQGCAIALFEDSDGSILMTVPDGKNQGLLRFQSIAHFQRDEFENILPGQSASVALRDQEGGWWISTNGEGVFYCNNPALNLLDTNYGLPTAEVKALASDGRKRMYAGLRGLDIALFQQGKGRPTLLPPPPIYEMQALRFDTLSGRLWCSNSLCFLKKGHWIFATNSIKRKHGRLYINAKKITSDPTGTHWLASSTYGFFSIDPKTGVAVPNNTSAPVRSFSVTPDYDGNLWVTINEGLRLWRNGGYELPPFHHPAMRFPARNMELLPSVAGGGMVIAFRGGGLLIRDKDGKFTHLTTREGLTSDVLSDLDITPDGRIYACSNAGLNILSPKSDGSWRIETFTTKHGLPSNQVNDVAFLGDEIWIATDRGIARFRGKPNSAPMPSPILEKFVVNNRPSVFSENLQLPHDKNNLAIRFYSLHFRSGGDIPYRYRLLGADTAFVYTRTREVNFANLSQGRYTFKVQAQNEDGEWSESALWPFEIRPPWWATWWFRSLVGATLVVALYQFYKNRLRSIRREAAEREKIRDLETAALRAQMNPHFIFNCLQAIQSFIAQTDRDAAATYLARFAKLVRLALHGSVDGHHTLTDEIAMLDNYLHLEQLRFRGKFEFSVRATEGLDTAEISLPPLLVQPFVENALIHGLQGRESGGVVDVVFASKGNLLEVSVTDNGQGFLENNTSEKTAHKSVGMMLTQKRLDLLMGGGNLESEHFVRETVLDEKGTPIGARVQILIPI